MRNMWSVSKCSKHATSHTSAENGQNKSARASALTYVAQDQVSNIIGKCEGSSTHRRREQRLFPLQPQNTPVFAHTKKKDRKHQRSATALTYFQHNGMESIITKDELASLPGDRNRTTWRVGFTRENDPNFNRWTDHFDLGDWPIDVDDISPDFGFTFYN